MMLGICAIAQIQVGVGLHSPEGLFHIDAAQNNTLVSGASKYNDDIVIDANGNVGLGVKLPTAKLHINEPAFRLEAGSMLNGNFLVSDNNGVGTWQVPPLATTNYTWNIRNTNYRHTGANQLMSGTVTASGNIPGIITDNTKYTLTVPKGKYLLMIIGDINVDEFATFELRGYYKNAPGTSHTFITFNYEHALNAIGTIKTFTDDVVLSMNIHLLSNYYYILAPSLNYTFPLNSTITWYQLNLLKLV